MIFVFFKAFRQRKDKIGMIIDKSIIMDSMFPHLSSLIPFLLQAMEQGTEMAAKQAVKRLNSVSGKNAPFQEAKKTR